MGVELVVGQTSQEIIEVHPTVPSPPGATGPQGPKGDPGGWVNASGIADGVDLNTLTTPGTYRRSTSAGSTRDLNYPTDGWAGWIEVIGASPGSLMQRATSLYSNAGAGVANRNVWVRTHAGTWHQWMRIDTPSYGTGMPNGAVAASVGERYIDTAATNGAIEWIKTTPTGNTGWQVTYGDTGWRDLRATALPTGWTLEGVAAATFKVRRVNSTVHVQIRMKPDASIVGTPVGTFTAMTLPTGFAHDGYTPVAGGVSTVSTRLVGALHTQGSTAQLTFMPIQGFEGTSGTPSWQPANLFAASASFPTAAGWPATLPGTAV